jgi:arginyl-tRNA synthetase
VIPGDIAAELAAAVRAETAAGDLPELAARLPVSGTWQLPRLGVARQFGVARQLGVARQRRMPGARPGTLAGPGGQQGELAGPGTYVTALPFRLARAGGRRGAAGVAAALGERLRATEWVREVAVRGGGYLSVTVSPAWLVALAPRVIAAGDGCARSDALAGQSMTVPASASLATAGTWARAWERATAAALARIAEAAGADVHSGTERIPPAEPSTGQKDQVADAIAYAGEDPVRYALARRPGPPGGGLDARKCVLKLRQNPYFAVTHAHASAASVLRWAADLGLERGGPADLRPGLLGDPREMALLAAISWLPERAAQSARRRRPGLLAACLENLSGAWQDCAEGCPALPAGGRAAPRDPTAMAARLWLAAAARTALATGLRLLGVAAPARV